jgi:hypothetical protein
MFLSPSPGLPTSRTNESSNGSLIMQATRGQRAPSRRPHSSVFSLTQRFRRTHSHPPTRLACCGPIYVIRRIASGRTIFVSCERLNRSRKEFWDTSKFPMLTF